MKMSQGDRVLLLSATDVICYAMQCCSNLLCFHTRSLPFSSGLVRVICDSAKAVRANDYIYFTIVNSIALTIVPAS